MARILIVEDESMERLILRIILQGAGQPVEPEEILEVVEKVIAQGPEIEPAAEDGPPGITEP